MNKSLKLGGVLLTFAILQIVYTFTMLCNFPGSLTQLIDTIKANGGILIISSIVSFVTLIAYCVLSTCSMVHVFIKKHKFLRLFQLSGITAIVGNLFVYVIRQIEDLQFNDMLWFQVRSSYYYWSLFLLALVWTLFWSIYIIKSSRVYSYMDEDVEYMKTALFFKGAKAPEPWVRPVYAPYAPQYPPQNQQYAQPQNQQYGGQQYPPQPQNQQYGGQQQNQNRQQ